MNTDLPIHPRTGLRAVGIVGGRPVWPIFGAEDNPPAPPAGNPPVPEPPKPAVPPAQPNPTPTELPAGDPPKDPADGDKPLGPNGEKALRAERQRADDMAAQLKKLAPLQRLAEALGASGDPATGKTEIEQITERLTNHETELKTEREARWRAEVANAKKLTPEQAAELRGSTAVELAAHADRLLELFPTAPAGNGTPRPDPSQGGQGGTPPDLDAQIAEATKKGDVKAVLRLQNQKLPNAKP